MKTIFTIVVERDSDWYVASVQELKGCHTQAKTLEELLQRVGEAIQLCSEVEASK